MHTYTVNVAEQDSQGRWQHLFRVEGLESLQLARRVAAIIQAGHVSAHVEITQWTKPVGETIGMVL